MAEVISYQECLARISKEFQDFQRGKLKQWCEENKLTYQTVINMKNRKGGTEYPNYIITILEAFNFNCYKVTKERKGKAVTMYMVSKKEAENAARAPQGEDNNKPDILNLISSYGNIQESK